MDEEARVEKVSSKGTQAGMCFGAAALLVLVGFFLHSFGTVVLLAFLLVACFASILGTCLLRESFKAGEGGLSPAAKKGFLIALLVQFVVALVLIVVLRSGASK